MVAAACHLDVVPEGKGWSHDPYDPIEKDGKLYARGAIDNKGPTAAVLYAMIALRDEGFVPKKRIRLITGLDEETGCSCLLHYANREEIPVAGFTPDGSFPVVYAEKGRAVLTFSTVRQQQDSDSFFLAHAKAGDAVNMVPSTCTYKLSENSLEKEELISYGKSAHASTPWVGVNAISKAFADIEAELRRQNSHDCFVRFYNACIADETDGKSLGLAYCDASGQLTLNAGTLRVTPAKAALCVDIRYPISMDFMAMLPAIEKIASDYGITVECSSSHPPLDLGINSDLIRTLSDTYCTMTGVNDEPIALGGGTYAQALPNIAAFGAGFPGDPEMAHQADEYVDINRLLAAAAIYRESLRALASDTR